MYVCRDLRSFEIRFEFESDLPIRIRFESDVCRHTNYTHSLFNKKSQFFAPFAIEIYVYNSTLRVAVLL